MAPEAEGLVLLTFYKFHVAISEYFEGRDEFQVWNKNLF